MKSLPTRLAVLTALVLAGCDSNPDAPSVPTGPTATPGATAAPGDANPTPPGTTRARGRKAASSAKPTTAD